MGNPTYLNLFEFNIRIYKITRWPAATHDRCMGPSLCEGRIVWKHRTRDYQLLKEYWEAACLMEASWAARRVGSSKSSSFSVAPAENWLLSSSIMESHTGNSEDVPFKSEDPSELGSWVMNMSSSVSGRSKAALFKFGWWIFTVSGKNSKGSFSLSNFFFSLQSIVIGVVRADPFSWPDLKKWVFLSSISLVDSSSFSVFTSTTVNVSSFCIGSSITSVTDAKATDEAAGPESVRLLEVIGSWAFGKLSNLAGFSFRQGPLVGLEDWAGLIGSKADFDGLLATDWLERNSDKVVTFGVTLFPATSATLFAVFDVIVIVFGREMIIGCWLLMPLACCCCCSRLARARNCSAVIVTTRGWLRTFLGATAAELQVDDESLNFFAGDEDWTEPGKTFVVFFVWFNAILPASIKIPIKSIAIVKHHGKLICTC